MGKPGNARLLEFKTRFDELNRLAGKRQFLTYYLIAAHPGCSEADMQRVRAFASKTTDPSGTGPGVYPHPFHLFQPDVLYRT